MCLRMYYFPRFSQTKEALFCRCGHSDLAVFEALFTGVVYYVALYFIYISTEFLLNILMYIICIYHH